MITTCAHQGDELSSKIPSAHKCSTFWVVSLYVQGFVIIDRTWGFKLANNWGSSKLDAVKLQTLAFSSFTFNSGSILLCKKVTTVYCF